MIPWEAPQPSCMPLPTPHFKCFEPRCRRLPIKWRNPAYHVPALVLHHRLLIGPRDPRRRLLHIAWLAVIAALGPKQLALDPPSPARATVQPLSNDCHPLMCTVPPTVSPPRLDHRLLKGSKALLPTCGQIRVCFDSRQPPPPTTSTPYRLLQQRRHPPLLRRRLLNLSPS